MELSRLAMGGRAWTTNEAQMASWQPTRGLLVLRITGKGLEDFALPMHEELEAALAKCDSLHVYVDVERLDRYDSKLRVRATESFAAHRPRIASMHVLFRSSFVAMGVAVANLALGNLITSHSKRSTFKRALDAHLSSLNLVGFSSEVLTT